MTTSNSHLMNFDETEEDYAKALAKKIASQRDDILEFQDQLSSTDTRIDFVQKSIGKLDASAASSH